MKKCSNQVTNGSGQILLETFAELDNVLVNVGWMFILRGRGLGIIVDLIFVNTSLLRGMVWEVSEQITHGDHGCHFFVIVNGETLPKYKT